MQRCIAMPDIQINNREDFLQETLVELTSTLSEVVGLEEAAGFMSVVGQNLGRAVNRTLRQRTGQGQLNAEQVIDGLLDLKNRINSDFYVISQGQDKIVIGNRRCPFLGQKRGNASLCMMTSNLFGAIVADNLGYTRVELMDAIADGAPECQLVIWLRQTPESAKSTGREYFRSYQDHTPA